MVRSSSLVRSSSSSSFWILSLVYLLLLHHTVAVSDQRSHSIVSRLVTPRTASAFLSQCNKALRYRSSSSSLPSPPALRAYAAFSHHDSAPPHGSKKRASGVPIEDESEALEWNGKTVDDLKAISSFFPAIKDNSTFFFYAADDSASFPEALVSALPSFTLDKAIKLHEIGAVYVHRQNKFRRTHLLEQTTVAKGELFRVYLHPRRFPSCFVDYRPRVRYEDDDLLVVDKPPGCPCSLHVSNAIEALDITASASLGMPLIRMNRLDAVTSGLVTLAKTRLGASQFWEEIRRDRVGKVYKALLLNSVPLGLIQHYMPGKIIHRRPAPRCINDAPLPGWKVCQCKVLSCTPLVLPTIDPQNPDKIYYEVEVELITGRTHQLRAQFSALGSPIVYDTMYIPLASFLLRDEDDPAIQALYPLCDEPKAETGIALQCSVLIFLDKQVQAGEPWWRLKSK